MTVKTGSVTFEEFADSWNGGMLKSGEHSFTRMVAREAWNTALGAQGARGVVSESAETLKTLQRIAECINSARLDLVEAKQLVDCISSEK